MADLRNSTPKEEPADVVEWLHLAEKLREHSGRELDESALQAVAEVSGAPIDVVRLALLRQTNTQPEQSFGRKIRAFFLTLDPLVRHFAFTAICGSSAGIFLAFNKLFIRAANLPASLAMLSVAIGLWIATSSREQKVAVASAAVGGTTLALSSSIALAIFNIFGWNFRFDSGALIYCTGLGALLGLIGWGMRHKKTASGYVPVDPQTDDRRKLLAQLVEIQDRLRAGEQTMSFMSVDVVGSTRMKENADPLAVEYTFGEYHEFVEKITQRYGGNVHSTAGDGVLCAFETPAQAFAAARNLQSGIFELNTYRNKLGSPMALRIGIHHGAVVPQGAGLQSINFSHVIDVASHLQKMAPEGGIAISTPAAGMLPKSDGISHDEMVEAENVKAYVWRPKVAPPAPPIV